MSTTSDILQIKLETTGDGKVKASLAGVEKQVGGLDDKTSGLSSTFTIARAGMAALAVGGVALGAKIISTTATFEKLNASLKTVTGSQVEASRAMDMIKALASDTPFSVQELTDSFIKLKAMGLEPSEEALISYGNTSAAMGKDLNMMIEAVADAATGEFERLKEFGIKARQQGDEVSLTFQGVTTTIGNNSEEIQKYLLDIGNTQFAGAMAEQMDTLNGAFSNLGDSTDRLFVAIGESGLGDAVKETTQDLSNMASVVAQNIEEMGFLEGSIVGLVQAMYGMEAARPLSETKRALISLDSALAVTKQHADKLAETITYYDTIPGISPEIMAPLRKELEAAEETMVALQQAYDELSGKTPKKADPIQKDNGPSEEEKKKSQKEYNDLMAEGLRIYADTRTEMELLYIDQARLDELLAGGAISWDTYSRAMFDAMDSTDDLADSGVDAFAKLEAAIRGWGDAFTDTMTEMVMSGKADFSALADSIIEDLVRIQIQKTITDPMVDAMSSFDFGSLFSASVNHAGGVIGQTSSTRSVSPSLFVGAPRYHSGGIVGDEVPAILRRGEEVLTETDPRHRKNVNSGGGGNLRVIIENRGSQQMQASEADMSFDADGAVVSIILNDQKNGGPISGGFQRMFGLQRGTR